MREIAANRAKINPAAYLNKTPDISTLEIIEDEAVVRAPDGWPLLAYVQVWRTGDPTLEALRAGLHKVSYPTTTRVNALPVRSVQFGYMPRTIIRRDFCKGARVDSDHPALAKLLYQTSRSLEQRYEALAPLVYGHHAGQAKRVLPEWRLPGAQCFTGGTINKDNAIGYHHDTGNFAMTFSAMPVVRAGMAGGLLCIPELGVALACDDGYCVYFDGQSLMHGVTPMHKTHRAGHRYSIVYYSASKLWQCLPPAAEVDRIQQRRTERESKRARGNINTAALRRSGIPRG